MLQVLNGMKRKMKMKMKRKMKRKGTRGWAESLAAVPHVQDQIIRIRIFLYYSIKMINKKENEKLYL